MENNKIIIVLSVCLTYVLAYNYNLNSYDPNFPNNNFCNDLSPHYGPNISLDLISGVWYAVEKIPHNRGEYKIDYTRECFYIDIKVDPYQHPSTYAPIAYPYLRTSYGIEQLPPPRYEMLEFVVEWHEGHFQEDYKVKVNTSHMGFWITNVPSTAVEKMYRHFGGVIQVLKVANNHLVLNFCKTMPYREFYSVVFSRNENQLTPEDLSSIHSIFTSKHLSTSALKRVCDNSGTMLQFSVVMLLLTSFLI